MFLGYIFWAALHFYDKYCNQSKKVQIESGSLMTRGLWLLIAKGQIVFARSRNVKLFISKTKCRGCACIRECIAHSHALHFEAQQRPISNADWRFDLQSKHLGSRKRARPTHSWWLHSTREFERSFLSE